MSVINFINILYSDLPNLYIRFCLDQEIFLFWMKQSSVRQVADSAYILIFQTTKLLSTSNWDFFIYITHIAKIIWYFTYNSSRNWTYLDSNMPDKNKINIKYDIDGANLVLIYSGEWSLEII